MSFVIHLLNLFERHLFLDVVPCACDTTLPRYHFLKETIHSMRLWLGFVWGFFFWGGLGDDSYCPTAPAAPADRRKDSSKLRIVQVNQ